MPGFDRLFNGTPWEAFSREHLQKCEISIDLMSDYILLAFPEEALTEGICREYELVAPTLNLAALRSVPYIAKIDVSEERKWEFEHSDQTPQFIHGLGVRLIIPFTGNQALFFVKPASGTVSPPEGQIEGNLVKIEIEGERLDPEATRKYFLNQLQGICRTLADLKEDCARFNDSLKGMIQKEVHQKRTLLERAKKVADYIHA
jgi:hypothetical protein